MTLKMQQLGPGLAVEISGIPLGDALDEAQIEQSRKVWMNNKAAVLHGQQLSDDDLLNFTQRMGPLLWDNAFVAHRRDAFSAEQRRFLKRTGFHLPEELAVPF